MHDLAEVTIRSASVSEMDNNVYLLTSRSSGAQVLIDAADDAPAILSLIADAQEDTDAEARLALIVTTHSHWDHVRALAEVREATHARTAAGQEDVPDIAVPTDVVLRHQDIGSFEGFQLEAIQLRGHTPGSIALLYRDPHGPAHLFTGDSLFPGASATRRAIRTVSPPSTATSWRGSSTPCPTTRWCTPGTGAARPSEPSAARSRNGSSAAGSPAPWSGGPVPDGDDAAEAEHRPVLPARVGPPRQGTVACLELLALLLGQGFGDRAEAPYRAPSPGRHPPPPAPAGTSSPRRLRQARRTAGAPGTRRAPARRRAGPHGGRTGPDPSAWLHPDPGPTRTGRLKGS
ncbi:MBL fold metallo-hydrolase [Vibrio cholerae]|nr:MBL fold metallo-hydrolase [Vibrio cholerae]